LALAERGLGHTRPNPAVGAVLVRKGEIIGEGWHRRAGGDHAEVAALKAARRRGFRLAGATLYVTLEPCSRAGRVGACTDAIIAAGLGRVVYLCADPNPANRSRAQRILRRAGIACERFTADRTLAAKGASLIRGFAKHVRTGLPYVTVKIALSLDGKICDDFGDARWVSSAAARRATGRLRERVDAIMVGGETVRRDNPSLLSHGKRNDDLLRVVVSRSGRLPASARLFTDGKNETLVFADAAEAIRQLGARGITHLLCEGGLKLATSLAEAGFVDEWLTVLAPKVIGTRPIAQATQIGGVACLPDW
jgi:diaminohydroxyphosphoribosylaminopyrimidine deaminase/5-amino-6-(5-phosphoribosylamino)uracil reductase